MVLDPGQARASAADPDDERRLVVEAQTGRREAREELARRFRRPAYLLALQIVGNPDDALDIAQDAMLRFFENLGRFRASQPVRPWLFTIVRNRARDMWRRRSNRPGESIDTHPDLVAQLADSRLNPEQTAVRGQRQAQVWRAIEALSPSQREIIFLRDFHDLPYTEIAAVLAIPVGTVMSRLHSARGVLRRSVKEGERNA